MNPENGVSERKKILGAMGAILAVGVVLANIGSIYGLLSTVYPIATTGVISSANIGVYWESQCINNVSNINWTTLSPGASKTVTVYVKNTGTVTLTLNMSTTNWVPSGAQTYFGITWDYAGAQIQPSGVLAVTFTLTVSQNIQGITSFSFDIRIGATQA